MLFLWEPANISDGRASIRKPVVGERGQITFFTSKNSNFPLLLFIHLNNIFEASLYLIQIISIIFYKQENALFNLIRM